MKSGEVSKQEKSETQDAGGGDAHARYKSGASRKVRIRSDYIRGSLGVAGNREKMGRGIDYNGLAT